MKEESKDVYLSNSTNWDIERKTGRKEADFS